MVDISKPFIPIKCPINAFCMRDECKPEPWIFENKAVKCHVCKREMCNGERYEFVDEDGNDNSPDAKYILCWSCFSRLLEIEREQQITMEFKDGTKIIFLQSPFDKKKLWK